MFDALLTRVRNVFRREAVTREMEEELRQHLEQSTDLLVRRGMAPDEARLAARQALGNATVIAEDARVARGAGFSMTSVATCCMPRGRSRGRRGLRPSSS